MKIMGPHEPIVLSSVEYMGAPSVAREYEEYAINVMSIRVQYPFSRKSELCESTVHEFNRKTITNRNKISVLTETQPDRDAAWWDENWEQFISTQHAGSHVAIRAQRIVYTAKSIEQLINQIIDKGFEPCRFYITYLPKSESELFPQDDAKKEYA
jgi:hypothetical protein